MYRRHIRMVQSRNLESNEGTRSQFIQCVSSIPAVFIAWSLAVKTYRSVKMSNQVINFSLTTAEKAASFVTTPVFKKFENQIKTADQLAYKGLKNLREIIPAIARKPEYVINHARDIYTETVESGLRKYGEVKQSSISTVKDVTNFGLQKSANFLNSPYGQLCVLAFDSAFDAYEMYLDHYLPPLGDEGPEQLFGDKGKQPIWERADILTNRFKERILKHSLLQFQNIRIRGKLSLAKLQHVNMNTCVEKV